MHFETKEDTDSPIDEVFAAVTDFESFERSAIRRGVEVRRNGDSDAAPEDLSWDVVFMFRGSERKMRVEVAECDRPNTVVFAATGSGMTGLLRVDLMALSPRRTRMTVRLEMKPKTLAARLLVQSLKLARNKLNRRYRKRVAEFVDLLENRQSQTA
ncbi:hypothetical protein TM1040_0171 [Ruegeria sp. TM1040]|jgi:carbon monoxide dehydrogenase subunit G|uniref:SRPBCC family protein n=1 Tax=Ruegeria sp. (strain TM1040) TaxID=292414 RepID=UPI000046290E|nr:SRPBCC family protein [Ruegeria sp. TM1040]ABF62904.1 hypothetical protein TM1040_0171 [Ruegeria sp. TM1040]MDF9304428.1 SRPBCC family protein [Tritonibacter mobilis]